MQAAMMMQRARLQAQGSSAGAALGTSSCSPEQGKPPRQGRHCHPPAAARGEPRHEASSLSLVNAERVNG